MAELDNVIKSIEGCVFHKIDCVDCDYDGCVFAHGDCKRDLLADALELLEEKEAVKPYSMNAERTYGVCPKCGKIVFRYGNVEENHYCGVCGKALKWG